MKYDEVYTIKRIPIDIIISSTNTFFSFLAK